MRTRRSATVYYKYPLVEIDCDMATYLDITRDICPMTFVRTRLALDRLSAGEELQVRLRGEEPRRNVPRTAADQGHQVVSVADDADGTSLVVIVKG